jgi:hypothetical protein
VHIEIIGQPGTETYCVSEQSDSEGSLAELSVFRGDDGAFVVQVDTFDDTGRVRVNVNDGAVFDGDCHTGERFELR